MPAPPTTVPRVNSCAAPGASTRSVNWNKSHVDQRWPACAGPPGTAGRALARRARATRALGIDSATLQAWQRRWDDLADRLLSVPLGATPLTCSALAKGEVTNFLTMYGTALGVAVLQDHFPALSRRDLGCLLHLARLEVDHVAAGGYYHCLTWHHPGRAWALDHTEPPSPIDGQYRFVLTVRDLASGCTLAAMAVASEDAITTIDVLRALFAQYGPPLLLKADNGPGFTSVLMRAFLNHHDVQFDPPPILRTGV